MASRGQTITVEYYAWDTVVGDYKTGDVANHTLRWTKDGTASAPTNSPAEVDAAGKPGAYKIVMTGTEASSDIGVIGGKSSTANVVLIPTHISFEQLPIAAPDAAGGLPVSDAGGKDIDALVELSATAQANLEDQYDGTGISGDTFPATQSQLSGIANVGSAAHKEFTGEVLTTPATTSGGSYTNTKALDEVYMFWDSVSGGFNVELTTNIGAGSPSGIKITGYLNGANDTLRVQMWDYQIGTPAYVTIGSWSGGGSSANQVLPYDAFIGMVGIGANLGDIKLRLYNDNGGVDSALTNANIYIDQVFLEFSQSAASVLDAIYFDSNASNTNTVPGTDGIPGNPVSTEAAVNTLLSSTNLSRVIVTIGSSITWATSHIGEEWRGHNWTLGLGGQDISNSHIFGASVTGVGVGSSESDFHGCFIGTCTINSFHMTGCGYTGTVTLGAAGDYVINDGHSGIAGTGTPVFDMGAALGDVNLSVPDWHNGFELRNLNAAGSDKFSISGIGQIIYAASCSGAVNQRGRWKETNTGGVTITYDDPSQNEKDILADTADMQPKVDKIPLSDGTVSWNATAIAAINAEVDTAISDASLATEAKQDKLLLGIIFGAAATGTLSTTQATTDLTGYTAEQLIGRTIIVTSGVAEGEGADITDYVEAGGLITFTAMTLAMGNNDSFKIV